MPHVHASDPIFANKYGELIARDFGMPYETYEDKDKVWRKLAELPSFTQAGGLPKMSRWFSWNEKRALVYICSM